MSERAGPGSALTARQLHTGRQGHNAGIHLQAQYSLPYDQARSHVAGTLVCCYVNVAVGSAGERKPRARSNDTHSQLNGETYYSCRQGSMRRG